MYRFKLQALLNHRRHQEEVCQKALARAEIKLDHERKNLKLLKDEKRANTRLLKARQKTPVSVSAIVISVNYLQQLTRDIEKKREHVADATRNVNQKRSELVESVKKRKTLERLKEQEQLAYRHKMMQNERKFMDEVAATRYARKS